MREKTGVLCSGITHLIKKFELLSIFLIQIAVSTNDTNTSWVNDTNTLWVVTDRNRGTNCNMIRAKEMIIADCASKGLYLDVPQDLDDGLQVLNLSYNHLMNVSETSFYRYQDSLTTLDMSFQKRDLNEVNSTNSSIDFEFSVDSFAGLFKLEYLDLTNSCYSKSFILPTQIRVLKIENCSSIMNVSFLHLLEEFHAAGNEWTSVPKFHNLSPLKYIDLRRNALLSFDIERIAPFCDLTTLRLDALPFSSLKREKHTKATYCNCRELQYWLTKAGVEHDHWECIPPLDDSFVPKCNLTPSEYTSKLRRDCLSKKPALSFTLDSNWWMIALALVIVLVLLIAALVVNQVKKILKRGASSRGNVKRSPYEDEEEEEEDYDDE